MSSPSQSQQQQAAPSTTASPPYLHDLEKCGIATSNNLRELLTTYPDPVEGIRNFQLENGIQLPSLTPVMKLLDLHGIRRTEYHEMVIAELNERMTAKLRALGDRQTPENVRKLEQHLERCFQLYRVPRIRPIVLETLTQLPKVADRYLKLIICDKEFYDQCAVSVKQQIWIKNESLFLEAIEPVLDAYIAEKEQLVLAEANFFTFENWKGRRQKKHIQELVSMIGQRELLYTILLDTIRGRFLSTGSVHYCSLRFELLMAAHDVNIEFLARADPCHDFAWCLDACAKNHRAKFIDAQQMAKLKTLLDTSKKGQSKPIAEMALVAADPLIQHMLASMAVKLLRDNATSGMHLPRELNSLQLIVKMLQMGLHAKELLRDETSLQQLLPPELFSVFLAAFSSMLVQDLTRAELLNAPEELAEFFAAEREIRPRHSSVDKFLESTPLCELLWLYHLIQGDTTSPLGTSKKRPFEPALAVRWLEALTVIPEKAVLNELWYHLFMQRLLQCPFVFSAEPTAKMVIHRIFIPQIGKLSCFKFFLLRLCAQHKSLISAELLREAVEPLIAAADDESEGEVPSFANEFDKHREQLLALVAKEQPPNRDREEADKV